MYKLEVTKMREIPVSEITEAVKKLCISANYNLNSDVYSAIENSRDNEQSPIGKNILSQLLENADPLQKKIASLFVRIQVWQLYLWK